MLSFGIVFILEVNSSHVAKKLKTSYEIDAKAKKLIDKDKKNKKLWEEALAYAEEGAKVSVESSLVF